MESSVDPFRYQFCQYLHETYASHIIYVELHGAKTVQLLTNQTEMETIHY